MIKTIHWLKKWFELSRQGDAGNVRPMEGLRGFAVFLVFLTHYVTLSPAIERGTLLDVLTDPIHTMGKTGVDLFFVLSGYLIYASMISRRQDFLPFMRRRIVRIYPAFTAVFVLYLVLSFVYPVGSKLPSELPAAIKYVVANFLLLPGVFAIKPMITVAWSLSYEMFYYLAIPLTIGLFRLRDRSTRFRVGFFLIVAAGLAAYCSVFQGHVRMLMFISGILLFEVIRNSTITAPGSAWALLALAVGVSANLLPFPGPERAVPEVLIQSAAFLVVCFTCFTRPGDWLARGFSWTPLRWLGNMSYSYYLLHGLALHAGYKLLFRSNPVVEHDFAFFFGMMPVMFAITLLPSAILFLLIERPFSLAAEPRSKSPKPTEAVSPA